MTALGVKKTMTETDSDVKMDSIQNAEDLSSMGGQKSSNENFYSCLSDVSMPDAAHDILSFPPTIPPTENFSGDEEGGRDVAPALSGSRTPSGEIF